MSRPKTVGPRRVEFDPGLVPGQDRVSGGAILLRLFLVLVALLGTGLAIALVTT